MVSEKELKSIISKVLEQMGSETKVENQIVEAKQKKICNEELEDITEKDIKDICELKKFHNKEQFLKYKQKTPARVGVSRAGSRYLTSTSLRFKADHAAAIDAVFSDVSDEFLKRNDLFKIQTRCKNKDEYLTRPDLGRRISKEGVEIIKENCKKSPKVQVYISDGLSSTAIEANIEDTLPSLLNGLKSYGIETGTPFFVKYGRVAAADEVSEVLDDELTCVLIGERPGLATSESMSAYITYKGYIGIPEAKRTVVSNIHRNGTSAAEAGAHIAHIIQQSLEAKASGQDLKL